MFLAACGDPPHQPPAVSAPAPVIAKLAPAGTAEKTPFQVQPNGKPALSVSGANFVAGVVLHANGQKLVTVFGNAGWLTAEFPSELFAKAGAVAIKAVNPDGGESAPVEFVVSPAR